MSNGADVLSPDQARVMAEGLYYVASVDGIDERETALIKEFLEDVGQPELFDKLGEGAFDPWAATSLLTTSHLRRVFLRAAIVLVRADGTLSDEERGALESVATAFEMPEALDELLAATDGETLD